jgi:glycosyltransferase involved in cell wall biosynthesis
MRRNLQVRAEGWLKGSHSFSLVNRFQIQALLREPGIEITHNELPPLHPGQHGGEDPELVLASDAQLKQLLSSSPVRQADLIYRLVTPTDLRCPSRCRLVSYLVTELGLGITRFADAGDDIRRFESEGGLIHTPTQWSKQRILHGGFSATSVHVIPNGVNSELYFPMHQEEIAIIRKHQGYTDDDVVLLNVGSPVWNKGLDVLIRCFAKLRLDHRNIHLVLKDQSSVYGVGVVEHVQEILRPFPVSLQTRTLEGIRIIPSFLSFRAMRQIMNAADYYVSPYRAEGFNMPVLESMSCGTYPVVTAMGSTSDFCNDENAYLIQGKLIEDCEIRGRVVDAYVEPEFDSLYATLQTLIHSPPNNRKLPASVSAKVAAQFSWQIAAKSLIALFRSII